MANTSQTHGRLCNSHMYIIFLLKTCQFHLYYCIKMQINIFPKPIVHHWPHVNIMHDDRQEQSGAYQHFKWNTLQRAVFVQWKITQLKEAWQMTFLRVKIMSRIVPVKQLHWETQNTKVSWPEAELMLVLPSNGKSWYELHCSSKFLGCIFFSTKPAQTSKSLKVIYHF